MFLVEELLQCMSCWLGRLTLRQSYEAVQQQRSRMKVNIGFQIALMKLEKAVFQVETNSLDFFAKRDRKRAVRYEDK
jgi:hypothetical protein